MQILTRQLDARGIAQQTRSIRRSNLTDRLSAVVMNSWSPAIPLANLGEHRLQNDSAFTRLLHEAYDAEAPSRV